MNSTHSHDFIFDLYRPRCLSILQLSTGVATSGHNEIAEGRSPHLKSIVSRLRMGIAHKMEGDARLTHDGGW